MATDLATLRQEQNRALDAVRTRLQKSETRLYEGAPRHISPRRMTTAALIAIRENPDLLTCTIDSLMSSLRQAAFHGWELGGPIAGAYLVPFNDGKKGTKEVVLIPGYRGLIDLMRRSGDVLSIDCEVVHQCDRFRVVKGDAACIDHEASSDPNRTKSPITHVYVIVHLRGGATQRKVWTTAEIDFHKEQFSKAWQKSDSPWQKHWVTMAYKTIIKQMVMRGEVPISGEIRTSLDKEDSVADAVSPVIDTTGKTTVTSATPDQIERQPEDDGQAETETTSRPHSELTDDELNQSLLLDECKQEIDAAMTLQATTDSVARYAERLPDHMVEELTAYAELRRQKIRSARGGRAKRND